RWKHTSAATNASGSSARAAGRHQPSHTRPASLPEERLLLVTSTRSPLRSPVVLHPVSAASGSPVVSSTAMSEYTGSGPSAVTWRSIGTPNGTGGSRRQYSVPATAPVPASGCGPAARSWKQPRDHRTWPVTGSSPYRAPPSLPRHTTVPHLAAQLSVASSTRQRGSSVATS